MQSTPASPLVQNGNSPAALQSHIYTSFLERKTADVALYVHGTWRAIYRLHRVVLIQAGFFQSLFTAGFSESRIKPGGHRLEPDVIDIVLEDPNITRAAFEICIARLYGGGPALFISPSLIATPKYPLTPSFPTSSVSRLEPRAVHISCPADQHPASPRFLLSILATSLFLSIPSVASQAITLILKTVGPGTAVRYLNFAIGKGIGEPEHEEPAAAVGLETVAELLKDDDEDSILECNESPIETPRAMSSEELSDKLKDLNMEFHSYAESNADRTGLGIQKEGPSDVASEASLNIGHTRHVAEPVLFYGAVSDKIGEASACWLARWGADMLRYEQQDLFGEEIPTVVTPASPIPTMRKRATTVPSHRIPGGGIPNLRPNPSQSRVTEWTKMTAPVVWRRGGLTARWVRGLLSSDSLFVQDEKERYDMSCAVAELRRAEGILPEEETEFDILFTKGIYYANMSLDDLMTIAKDISPSTSLPYVPMSILQSAHWNQSVLRHRITARASGSSPSSPTSSTPAGSSNRPKEVKELGISISTSEIGTSVTSAVPQSSSDALHFPIPNDSSTRIGDSTGIDGASMDQLFDVASPKRSLDGFGILSAPPSETNFFGLQPHQLPALNCAQDDPTGKAQWSPYPPFRFGVEFWDVDALKEKSRLHSRTISYAGSLWNVYVQVVRKKGVQLGVYLHRQSTVDPIPPSSAPVSLPSPSTSMSSSRDISQSNGVPLHQTISFPTQYSPSGSISRSTTPHSTPSSPAFSSSLPSSYSSINVASSNVSVTVPATAPPVMPQQPYRDPRGSVSAYFTIACASATGASLTRFTSAPDAFAVSQSWGWKSSSLRTEEYLEVGEDGMPQATLAAGKEVSFRATVVLGVV